MNGFGQQYGRALMTAKRRARLSGRGLSTQEMSGITAGYARGASERLFKGKGLQLQERGLSQQQSQFEASQTQRESQFGRTMEEAGLTREQTATLQARRLASQKELQESGQEWRTGERVSGQEFQAGETAEERKHAATERVAGQEWRTGEGAATRLSTEEIARLDREELIRQFDLLYGPGGVADKSGKYGSVIQAVLDKLRETQ